MDIITVPLKDLGSVARASKSRQKQDSLEKVAYNRWKSLPESSQDIEDNNLMNPTETHRWKRRHQWGSLIFKHVFSAISGLFQRSAHLILY